MLKRDLYYFLAGETGTRTVDNSNLMNIFITINNLLVLYEREYPGTVGGEMVWVMSPMNEDRLYRGRQKRISLASTVSYYVPVFIVLRENGN